MQAAVDASACFIGDFPDELLVNIVSHLRVERGCLVDERAEEQRRSQNSIIVRTLHALTLSCQKFSAVATPFLYQNIIQTKAQPCTQLQLRTLMEKRELAQCVQYVEFDTFNTSDKPGYKSPPEVDVSNYRKQLVVAQWHVRPPETTSQMMDRIMGNGNPPSSVLGPRLCPIVERLWDLTPLNVFTVLIAIADNIQDMSLPDHGAGILSLVVYKEYIHAGIFRRLWLRGTGSEMRYPMRMYCGIPDAQHGHLVEYLWRLLADNSVCLETRSAAALKELSLDVYDTNPVDFEVQLRKCTSLERFSCRWRWTDQFIGYEVNLPGLYDSLQHVQSTLSHLTIDTMDSVWLVDMERITPGLGSLRNFKALRYLNATGLVLWGDDEISGAPPPLSALLPESLQTLIIKAKWDKDVEDALYQLSVDCAVQLPVLRQVECTWSPAPASVANYLIDTFRLGGVKLLLQY